MADKKLLLIGVGFLFCIFIMCILGLLIWYFTKEDEDETTTTTTKSTSTSTTTTSAPAGGGTTTTAAPDGGTTTTSAPAGGGGGGTTTTTKKPDGSSCINANECVSQRCLRNTCRSIGWCSIGSDCASGFCGGINSCTDGAINSSCNTGTDCSSGFCNLVTRRCETQPAAPPDINFTYNTNMANGLEILTFTHTGDLRPTDSAEILVSFNDSSLSGSGTVRTVNVSDLLNGRFFVAGRPDSPGGNFPGTLTIIIRRNSVEITRKSISYTESRVVPPE